MLKRHVERSLDLDTTRLDFGVIRKAAEKELQLEVGLTKDDRSGPIIKEACVSGQIVKFAWTNTDCCVL